MPTLKIDGREVTVDPGTTILQAAGLPEPKVVNGTKQIPMEGKSLMYSFEDAKARERHTTQYFEIAGNRAIYHDGWFARTIHRAPWEAKGRHPLNEDVWDLYNVRADFSLTNNLAAQNPKKLKELHAVFIDGVSSRVMCSLVDIPVAELWKFKHNLDNGKAGLSSPQAVRTAPSTEPSNSAVPDPVDPVWEKLLDGSINLDIHALSLKLLLTKFREQFLLITDADVRMLKTHELQRYFVRHEKLLGHELTQLLQLSRL